MHVKMHSDFRLNETGRPDEGGRPLDGKTGKSEASEPAYMEIRPRSIPGCLGAL